MKWKRLLYWLLLIALLGLAFFFGRVYQQIRIDSEYQRIAYSFRSISRQCLIDFARYRGETRGCFAVMEDWKNSQGKPDDGKQ